MAMVFRLLLPCLLAFSLPGCSTISDITDRLTGGTESRQGLEGARAGDGLPPPGDYGSIPYVVEITGTEESALTSQMEDAGLLYRLRNEPPAPFWPASAPGLGPEDVQRCSTVPRLLQR